tara:strand:- start:277 stop:924 length:648 start_codon:yes stop_codon:yes gene_type:complete
MTELNEIQKKLKAKIPFKWRVQSFSKYKAQATCVSYIDSRDVQDVLDASCNWSDRYYSEAGLLFCEITIYADGKEYKRADTGSESNVDKQKGHSSDAFKRAAVKFGVGRFLYSQGMQRLDADAVKTSSNYPNVIDDKGNKIWDLTKHINLKANKANLPKENNIPNNLEDAKKWLTEAQLNATLKATEVQAQKVLNTFKMKKEYKEKIISKFNLNK